MHIEKVNLDPIRKKKWAYSPGKNLVYLPKDEESLFPEEVEIACDKKGIKLFYICPYIIKDLSEKLYSYRSGNDVTVFCEDIFSSSISLDKYIYQLDTKYVFRFFGKISQTCNSQNSPKYRYREIERNWEYAKMSMMEGIFVPDTRTKDELLGYSRLQLEFIDRIKIETDFSTMLERMFD